MFGDVRVERLAYRACAHADLHPADAALNLPAEQHSHGLRRLAALEAARSWFAEAAWSLAHTTGQRLGNRQIEQLTRRAAADFDDYYATRSQPLCEAGDVLVLSCDGKGIVMRPQALRPATAKAATSRKLVTHLSKGEQRHRKRLAEVGCVYDCAPVPRTPGDILPAPDQPNPPGHSGPRARGKWLVASVTPTPPRSSARSSTKPNVATPASTAPGSRWSTATTTNSPGSTPKPRPAGCR